MERTNKKRALALLALVVALLGLATVLLARAYLYPSRQRHTYTTQMARGSVEPSFETLEVYRHGGLKGHDWVAHGPFRLWADGRLVTGEFQSNFVVGSVTYYRSDGSVEKQEVYDFGYDVRTHVRRHIRSPPWEGNVLSPKQARAPAQALSSREPQEVDFRELRRGMRKFLRSVGF